MVFLGGGPSQLDTYDMKPDAPAEFRGAFNPIRSNVPGMPMCELMPRQARIADKLGTAGPFAVVAANRVTHLVTGPPRRPRRPPPVQRRRPELYGKGLPFPGVKVKNKIVTVRTKEETDALQEAAATPKSNYVKSLANDPASVATLKKAGIPDPEILRMKDGYSPAGYQVHHKHPLKLGGDNSQSNFILMQSHPKKPNYHSALTNEQNEFSRGSDGETIEVELPEFTGIIYPS